MLTIKDIKDYYKLENSHAKKELGQNFLINAEVCDSIVNALKIEGSDKVLEIGPGLGALTERMLDKSQKFVAVEYDAKFVRFLEMSFAGHNLEIVKNNIVKNKDYDFNKVIGNLPYYMTTDIIEYIVTNFREMSLGIFMVQKECYLRMLAISGEDASALNHYLNYMYDIRQVQKVGKDNFFPVPSVDSIVFSLTQKNKDNFEFGLCFYKLCKILFLNRRKTISNNLNAIVKDKEATNKYLAEVEIPENERVESVAQIKLLNLTKILLNNEILKL